MQWKLTHDCCYERLRLYSTQHHSPNYDHDQQEQSDFHDGLYQTCDQTFPTCQEGHTFFHPHQSSLPDNQRDPYQKKGHPDTHNLAYY